MGAKSDTWMPLYIADYLRKTMRLTRDQHGGYMLLLMACWDGGGRIPNDPGTLAAITKASPAEWKKLAPVLLPFFDVDGDDLTQSRVVAEHAKSARLSEARRISGGKGGRPKKEEYNIPKPIGFVIGSQTETPLQEPYGSNLDIEGSNDPSLSVVPTSESATPKRAREEPIPDGFPDASAIAQAEGWISEAGVTLDPAKHSKRFRNHAESNDRRSRNWSAAWRGWITIEIEKAPAAQAPAATVTRSRWSGPADVLAAFASAKGEEWCASYISPCGWQDVPSRALIAPNSIAVTRIGEALRAMAPDKIPALEGLSVQRRDEAAA